jgi:1-acyl-sn-glycerol-3-phosphate acyltransferase
MEVRHSPLAWATFESVFQPWMRRRLAGVHLGNLPDPNELEPGPLLLVANHVSWWDGFLLREVQRRLRPGRPFHVVMAEAQLRTQPVLQRLGAVPLRDGPFAVRGLGRALEAICHRDPTAVIGYFPQGRIWPSYRRPLGFSRSGEWLARYLEPVTVIPVALHIEPLNRLAPTAFIGTGGPVRVQGEPAPASFEDSVSSTLDGLLEFLARYGEKAPGRWGSG